MFNTASSRIVRAGLCQSGRNEARKLVPSARSGATRPGSESAGLFLHMSLVLLAMVASLMPVNAGAAAPSPTSQPEAAPKFVRVQDSIINLQHVNQINFTPPADADGYYTITIYYLGDASPHVIPIKEAAEAKRAWQILVDATRP
jgi:hypothetical protein